ncbi:MAG: hypothetical protein OEQ39_25565, partial [Gammaproteobacteria bacterium]|nr:hypothetical protein [Gammaproteobacteria bacterium]
GGNDDAPGSGRSRLRHQIVQQYERRMRWILTAALMAIYRRYRNILRMGAHYRISPERWMMIAFGQTSTSPTKSKRDL